MFENKIGTDSFPIVEINGILLLQGQKLAEGVQSPPSVHQQEKHFLFKTRQQTTSCVPYLSSKSALGRAFCETIHDEMCGASAASTIARSSRYFNFMLSQGPLFKKLADGCFICCRICMEEGVNLISPLWHLTHDTMLEGM